MLEAGDDGLKGSQEDIGEKVGSVEFHGEDCVEGVCKFVHFGGDEHVRV